MSSQVIADSELDQQASILSPSKGELVRVIILGIIAGAVIPLLSFALGNFFIDPVFCRSTNIPDFCSDINSISYYISSGIMAATSVVVLANWQVFRPLIIAVASAASLWGLGKYLGGIADNNTFEYYAFSIGIYLSSYVMFYWAMRIKNFTFSLIISILLIIAIRLALVS